MEPITMNIPVLALRGLTVFPHMNLTFDVERRVSIAALERAMEADQDIFLVTQRDLTVENPEAQGSIPDIIDNVCDNLEIGLQMIFSPILGRY